MVATPIIVYATDLNGAVQSGAKLFTYAAGTTTNQATYTDSGLGTPAANPVVCDSGGRAVVWMDSSLGDYKLILKNSAESATYFSQDNIDASAITPYLFINPSQLGDQSLNTTDSPTFASITLGAVPFSGVVTDPGADRLMFWDDSDTQVEWLSLGTGLAITDNTLSLDGDLEDISGLTPSDGAVIIGNGSEFVTESGATARTSLGVAVGSDVLAYDANLQAFADAFTAPTTDGSAGQYLKTDGAGDLTFATPAGAGDVLAAADENISGIWAGGQADTIATLAARSVSGLGDGDIASVTDDYRWGFFRWTTGNQSANVTADTKQGIWVAPDSDNTGASGAWQRVVLGPIHADWFIEPGDSDDTDGIQAALDYASANEGVAAEGQRGATVLLARREYYTSSVIQTTGFGYVILEGQGLPGSKSGNVNIGGTTIVADHTAGHVLHVTVAPFRVAKLQVTATANRTNNGSTSDNGIHFEAPDDADSASKISYPLLHDVRVIQQPGYGVAVIGDSVGHDFQRVSCLNNGNHGVLIDRGTATGRVHTMLGGQAVSDAAITSGDATLTSASALFADPDDVGARILVKGAGPNGYDLETTIASVTSATEVELTQSASTTVSGAVAQYGGAWARPGLGVLYKVLTADNGGHGIALGHPADSSKIPYRFRIIEHESFRNVGTTSLRYSAHDSWIGAEQTVYEGCATGAESSRSNLLVQGENIRVAQFRGISPSNSGHNIQIASAAEAANLNGVATGVDRVETDDVLIDGISAGGTPASTFRIDNHGGQVRIFGVTNRDSGTPLFNATRNNVLYSDEDGNLTTTGAIELKRSASSDLALRLSGNPTTGFNSLSGDSLSFVAVGAEVFVMDAAGIKVSTGGRLLVPRGSNASPSLAFSVDDDTGFYSRTTNEANIATGGAEGLRVTSSQVMSGNRGTAAAPAFTCTVDSDTGLFLRTANEANIAAGGAEIVRVSSSGADIRTGALKISGTSVIDGLGAAIADLNQTISDPPTQAEVQAISDKIDVILATMRDLKPSIAT
jgi:hypothetical protein